jgi:hypothetical protein
MFRQRRPADKFDGQNYVTSHGHLCFRQRTRLMEKGDLVMLFTDGISRGCNRDSFNEEQLRVTVNLLGAKFFDQCSVTFGHSESGSR